MKREPFFANFWVRAGYDSALSPRLPLRIAFTALFFLLFAWLVWMIWPKPDISAIWFYGFGALTFVGLLFANEQIMYHRMFLTSKSKTWYGALWSQTSIPLLVAMVLFHMVCYTPSFSFRELPETPLETAAKHWACVFFPVMVLFSVGLHLLLQYTKTEVDRREFVKWKSMARIVDKDILEMEEMLGKMSAEPFRGRARKALPLLWEEGIAAYMDIAPDRFERPHHVISSPYFFRVLPPYGYRTMVARINLLVKDGYVTVEDAEGYLDNTYVELAYKGRKKRFRCPDATGQMDEMMGEMALLLAPDYELRHCRLTSEPGYVYQWMVCLQPAQWRAAERKYGKERVDQYFGRVDRRYKAGPKLDRETRESMLMMYKLARGRGSAG